MYMMTSWKPGDPDFECIKANFMYLMDGIASIPFMWLRGRYYRAIKVPLSTFTINLLCPDLQDANLMRILFSNLFMISLDDGLQFSVQIGRAIFGASARIRIEVLRKATFEWFMGIQCSWFLALPTY